MSFLLRHLCHCPSVPWQRLRRHQLVASSLRLLTTRSFRDVNDDRIHGGDSYSPFAVGTSASKPFLGSEGGVDGKLENLLMELDSVLRLSARPSTTYVTSSVKPQPTTIPFLAQRRQPSFIHQPLRQLSLHQHLSPLPPLSLNSFSPTSIVPGAVGDLPSSIAPPPPTNRIIDIKEPTSNISIGISDVWRKDRSAVVGDQPSASSAREIIGDKMDDVIKKEAIRILQIRRTKMNRHKLRKWRRKFRHLIKKEIEEKEKREKKEMDDAVAAIHADADAFNPVDKVRRHVALAKDMGYRVTYYENLPLAKWLKEKEAEDVSNAVRFDNRNRDRYRKLPPWEYEKF